MKISRLAKLTSLIAFVAIVSSCKDKQPHFTIEGKIGEADSTTLYLERRTLGETLVIDSTKLDKEGTFKMEVPSIDHAEFYRLRLDKQIINLAIDSTETISIEANKATFANNYTVGGDGAATNNRVKDITVEYYKLVQEVVNLNKQVVNKKTSHEEYLKNLGDMVGAYKTKAKETISADFASLSAYYTLFQKVDGYSIFDPMDKDDLKLFRAVATAWDQKYVNSPRAKHLHDYTITAIAEARRMEKSNKALGDMLEESAKKEETNFYDIALPNIKGEIKSNKDLRGKVSILDLTAYQTSYSPAHNILLNEVYKQFNGNVEIYQVSFDDNLHAWQNTASNLPWICVRDNKGLNSDLISKFNVFNLPTTYILDKNGEPIKRILPTDNIIAEINKLK